MKLRLSETQQQIVNHGEGALLVVAGPGSGKTRVLVERIRRILKEENGHFRVLALTFTNKAANEMRERLSEFPDIHQRAYIGTLHSFCMEVLASRGKSVGIENLPNIFESSQDRMQVLVQAVSADPHLTHLLKAAGDQKSQNKLLNRWMGSIEDAKNQLYFPEMIEDLEISHVYTAYNQGLRASGAIDYGDLLLLTYKLFTERPKVADFYRRQYRYICIDEAQDLNEAQYQLLRALCGLEYKNVMMVGDPKQAIYVWNGADPKYLDQFSTEFEATKINLSDNFRSSQKVVGVAKKLVPTYEVKGRLPIVGELTLLEATDEAHEAELVLEYLQNLRDHGHKDIEGEVELERCALIARTRYAFNSIEKALQEKGWKFHTPSTLKLESESDALKDFELLCRLLVNPRDKLHLGMLLARWKLKLPAKNIDSFDDTQTLFNALKKLAKSNVQKASLAAIDALEWTPEKIKLSQALDQLDTFASTLSNAEDRALINNDTIAWRKHWNYFVRSVPGGQSGLSAFLGHLALGMTQQPHNEGLALLTVHASKGLEFDVVVLMGMAEGTFPDYRATGPALEEEARNAFVGVTRSRRLLAFSYPKSKTMPWGDQKTQKPSRYLKQVGVLA